MSKLFIYRTILLCLLLMSGKSELSAQFLRTRIILPPGIQIINSGFPNQFIPGEDYTAQGLKSMVWIELRTMVNLQLVVEYQPLLSLTPVEEKLLVVNDGSEDFAHAHPQEKFGFVITENPSKTVRSEIGLRPYIAWLGIPYQARSITTIHYP